MVRRLWSKHELFEALRLYCVTPFGKIHSRNPEIIALAQQLDRTPSSIALKMVNFASLDPTIDRAGMSNVSRLDREVWDEFLGDLMRDQPSSEPMGFGEQEQTGFDHGLQGLDAPSVTNRRINQNYFRKLVLASYNGSCAATGITAPELLVAGHIIPWSENTDLRLTPANGICLNNLFDKAFDRHLIAIGPNLEILYSKRLPVETADKMRQIAFEKIQLPSRFRPDPSFFETHRANFA